MHPFTRLLTVRDKPEESGSGTRVDVPLPDSPREWIRRNDLFGGAATGPARPAGTGSRRAGPPNGNGGRRGGAPRPLGRNPPGSWPSWARSRAVGRCQSYQSGFLKEHHQRGVDLIGVGQRVPVGPAADDDEP